LVQDGVDSIGRTLYKCLPAIAVDPSMRIGFSVLCIVLMFITAGFGVFAHYNRNIKVYKSASPFFTNLITFGCLIQLSSIITQISANSIQCMLREWLEFVGFALVLGSIILKVFTNRTNHSYSNAAYS
jgi:hypothetical protein